MQGDRRSTPHQLENRRAVLNLLVNIARLAGSRESRKASSSGSHSPGRNCHSKRLSFGNKIFYVQLSALQHASEMIEVFVDPLLRFCVLLIDEGIFDFKPIGHNASISDSVEYDGR